MQVVIDKHPVRFFVHKRPHVDFFLEVVSVNPCVCVCVFWPRCKHYLHDAWCVFLQVSQWYELVVFTASMEIYGSAVADKLDNNRNILKRRYYRQVTLCGGFRPIQTSAQALLTSSYVCFHSTVRWI